MNAVSRHFPPVVHDWSCTSKEASQWVPEPLIQVRDKLSSLKRGLTRTYSLHQLYSIMSCCNPFPSISSPSGPSSQIVTQMSLKRDLMRRIALSALQIRFNVQQRQDPLFTFVDFNQLNWPREGCAVCSLDLTTDPSSWRGAVKVAVQEIVGLGVHGLTKQNWTVINKQF